jgi:hypothetical protein
MTRAFMDESPWQTALSGLPLPRSYDLVGSGVHLLPMERSLVARGFSQGGGTAVTSGKTGSTLTRRLNGRGKCLLGSVSARPENSAVTVSAGLPNSSNYLLDGTINTDPSFNTFVIILAEAGVGA